MKKLAILMLFMALSGLQAAEKDTRVFQLKYADPRAVRELLMAFGPVVPNIELKALSITALKESFPEIEEIIHRLDVPPRNIEVTIYLMSALGTPSAGAVPAELESVVKQLKSTFSYKSYQLIDTELIRVRAGEGGEVSGIINGAPAVEGAKPISQIKFKSATFSTDERGVTIRIDLLKLGVKVPTVSGSNSGQKQYQYIDTGISTDVDIREGQKVVVGKANMDGTDRASIVVLTAKLVN
jgi:hypothetical protein